MSTEQHLDYLLESKLSKTQFKMVLGVIELLANTQSLNGKQTPRELLIELRQEFIDYRENFQHNIGEIIHSVDRLIDGAYQEEQKENAKKDS